MKVDPEEIAMPTLGVEDAAAYGTARPAAGAPAPAPGPATKAAPPPGASPSPR
jgi:hypothetical protein